MKQQLSNLHSKLGELNLDCLLLTNNCNLTYLTGYKNEDAYLLIDKRRARLLTDSRNFEEAKESTNFQVVLIKDSIFNTLPELLKKTKPKTLGFESKSLDFASYDKLKSRLKGLVKLVPTFDLVEDIRQMKNDLEIKLIKKAVAITKSAFEFAKKTICPSITENELIAKIERFIKGNGAQGFAFAPIAASARRSSFPHATSTDKKIGNNTSLTLDMGVSFRGYKSDLTRVFFLGRITSELRNIYDIILQAQKKAFSAIKPGISAAQIDNQARSFIAQKGFGRFFQHSTGHGIGLEVHEKPYISRKNEKPIASTMVFTVEPGIYLPHKFGVRIEDMVLVTQKGCKVLSDSIDKSA
jgi:Xaa-Pro aminopeptidase